MSNAKFGFNSLNSPADVVLLLATDWLTAAGYRLARTHLEIESTFLLFLWISEMLLSGISVPWGRYVPGTQEEDRTAGRLTSVEDTSISRVIDCQNFRFTRRRLGTAGIRPSSCLINSFFSVISSTTRNSPPASVVVGGSAMGSWNTAATLASDFVSSNMQDSSS